MDTENNNLKPSILLVDDDSFLLDMYELKLKEAGFSVSKALNGLIALDMLKKGLKPDVIMTGVIMPEMDGFEFLKELKDKKIAPRSIKIILTNRGEPEDMSMGASLDIVEYIVKTNSTPIEIIETVKRCLKDPKPYTFTYPNTYKQLITNSSYSSKLTNKNILALIASGFLFFALIDGLPYGYFTFLRFVVCAIGVYVAYQIYENNKKSLLVWIFAGIAVLFNPIIIIHLQREQWWVIDLIVGVFFVLSVFFIRVKDK